MADLRTLSKRPSVDHAAHSAATSDLNLLRAPTERQTGAGNYRKGHITISGLRIAIENPEGSKRRPEWPPLTAHYGYVKGTKGADDDHVDVFVRVATPNDWRGTVYCIDQVDQTGVFDEHKCMIGWDAQSSAVLAYMGNYDRNWRLGAVTAMSWDDFREWLRNGDTTTPIAKTWAQSASATSGITAYGNTGRRRRRAKNLYSTSV